MYKLYKFLLLVIIFLWILKEAANTLSCHFVIKFTSFNYYNYLELQTQQLPFYDKLKILLTILDHVWYSRCQVIQYCCFQLY